MTRSQKFIETHKKVLVSGAAFYNPDTTLMDKSRFETAKCRMLLILPTCYIAKTVSSTVAAINDYIITHCPDTFLDVAYMPEPEDIKQYDKWNLPYAIGHITHLDPSHFDIIGFSISVIHEIVATPVIINTFSRCDKPIPLFWSQRKDLSIKDCPILYAGGITAVCGESMFGKVNTGDSIEQAYLDFLYLGECDQTDILINRLLQAKESGVVNRSQSDHDVVGKPHEDIPNFEESVQVSTVQDYVDSLFDMTEIYQPQAYEVEYNSHNQIIKNIKINPKARDFVTPYYPHKLPDDLGIGRAVIQANGDACGKVHVAVSNGCSAAGSCSFKVAKGTRLWTNKGLVKIEDCDTTEIHGLNLEHSKGVCKQSSSIAFRFVTSDGHELIADSSHRFLVVEHDKFVEKPGYSLKSGDVILRALGGTFGNGFSDYEFADLLGFLHGDGCFDVKNNRVKIYMSSEELPHYEPLFRRYFPSNSKTRVHYRSENTTIYVIESNISSCIYDVDLAPVHCLDLYVPEFIFTGTKEVICSYLSGIFQADGWITNVIGLTSISKKYVQDISLLLSYVGIDSTVRCNDYFSRRPLDGHKISYYILIPKPFHAKFSDLINTPVKHVSDTHIGNRTKSNLFNTPEIQNRCRRIFPSRDSVRAVKLGEFFEPTRNKISDSKFRHAFQYGLFEEGRPSYYVASGRFVTDTIASVECLDYTVEMYDVLSTDSSYCIYDSWLTHNCSEGNYSGGWVEQDPETIKKLMREAKKYSAAYTFKPFSYNSNYLKDYKGQLSEWIQMYPKVTFNNMRMEELGRDVDAMKIMKLIGFDRIAAPLEGLSPRLQNNLLNKCLSQEAMDNFMDYMVHAHMIDMKVGTIYTGYEEDEDYQWFLDYIKSFKKRAAEEGGTFPVRLKATPLVHYPLTPMEYLERRSTRKSYNGERWLTDEWYDKFWDERISFKVNGFKYSTLIEQTFLDLGRYLSQTLYDHFIKDCVPIHSTRSCATDEYIQAIKDMIDEDYYFNDREPEHYISPCHRIHIELMGSYIPRARRLVRLNKQGKVLENEPDTRCLRTYVGAPTKCYHTCIAKEPLMVYNDVTMDEQGNLHGDSYPLTGCQRCVSNEERKGRLTRDASFTKNSEDIIAARRIPQVQKIRFIINRLPEYDVLNPNNTAYTFVTKFLQASDTLLDSFHSIVNHNMYGQSGVDYKDFQYGVQIVDTLWSKNVIKEVKSLIPEVNKNLKSVQVSDAIEILRDEKFRPDDWNFYIFESNIPRELFDSAQHSYKGQIKVEETSRGFALTEKIDHSLFAPVVASLNGKTVGCFAIPLKYNPNIFLSSYISQVRKTSEEGIISTTVCKCSLTMRETHAACKNCGKEPALISIASGKPMPFGKECLCKAILTQFIKNV